jgi:hypothetical protein
MVKLIYIPFNSRTKDGKIKENTEVAYVEANIFHKLYEKGFINLGGGWIQHALLWPELFNYLARHKDGS